MTPITTSPVTPYIPIFSTPPVVQDGNLTVPTGQVAANKRITSCMVARMIVELGPNDEATFWERFKKQTEK